MSGEHPDHPGGEFAWIARLARVLGGESLAAIGDDTATILSDGGAWAWTVDTLVEGVHFRFDWLDPEAVGRRALVASLSDLAAAGAEPAGALVAAAGPADTFARRIEGVYRGLRAAGNEAGCPVLGGDLARAEGPLHLTVTALGRTRGRLPLGRSGVMAGDELWLTGALGGPAAALALLAAAADGNAVASARAHEAYERLAAPRARLAEVAWLRERVPLHGGIDLSDGLSGDAGHLAERSGVAIVLDTERVPLHPGAVSAARARGTDPAAWALHGGEEFELLLAAPAGAIVPHADAFVTEFGLPLTRIGEARAGNGVIARRGAVETSLAPASWDHFA